MSESAMQRSTLGHVDSAADAGLGIRRYQALHQLPQCYEELFDRVGAQDFFLSRHWFENFAQTLVTAKESVVIYGVEDAARIHAVGAFVMWRRPGGLWKPTILQNLANYYSPSSGPIFQNGQTSECIQCFVEALSNDRQDFAVLDFRCLDPEAPYFRALTQTLAERGFAVQTYFQYGNWYLPVQGRSYTDYVAGLSTVLKKNIPYQTRRLERTFRVEIKLTAGFEGLDKALQDYDAVYHSSWRDREASPRFIHGMAGAAARVGALRLAVLYADGQPVAAQFWLVHGGTASIYKIAYVDQFAKYSVGTVLTAHMMRHALDVEKVGVVDYLSGDDPYKRDWMSHRRERWGILAFNLQSLKGLALAARHLGGRTAKRAWGHLVNSTVEAWPEQTPQQQVRGDQTEGKEPGKG